MENTPDYVMPCQKCNKLVDEVHEERTWKKNPLYGITPPCNFCISTKFMFNYLKKTGTVANCSCEEYGSFMKDLICSECRPKLDPDEVMMGSIFRRTPYYTSCKLCTVPNIKWILYYSPTRSNCGNHNMPIKDIISFDEDY